MRANLIFPWFWASRGLEVDYMEHFRTGLNSALLTGLNFFAIRWTISTPVEMLYVLGVDRDAIT